MGNILVSKDISTKKIRYSGIELLKIIAIILIINSHVIQTLYTENLFVGFNDYVLNINTASNNTINLIIAIVHYLGHIGTAIFFVSSAWFFLDSKKNHKDKLFNMMMDVFIISVLYLCILLPIVGLKTIGFKMIIKCFFPTFFQNNWYITAYIIFSFIYPYLNEIINNLSRNKLLTISVFFFISNLIISNVVAFPYLTELTNWVGIYFIMAYLKKYGMKFCDSNKLNIIFLILCLLLNTALVIALNYLGLNFSLFQDKVLKFSEHYNGLLVISAFCLFNLVRKLKFTNKIINYISSLTLLIYIIHENILFRTFIRPQIWQWIYLNLGYQNILLWIFLYTIILFIASLLISALYDISLRKLIVFFSKKIYQFITKIWERIITLVNKVFE